MQVQVVYKAEHKEIPRQCVTGLPETLGTLNLLFHRVLCLTCLSSNSFSLAVQTAGLAANAIISAHYQEYVCRNVITKNQLSRIKAHVGL